MLELIALVVFVFCSSLILLGVSLSVLPLIAGVAGLLFCLAKLFGNRINL